MRWGHWRCLPLMQLMKQIEITDRLLRFKPWVIAPNRGVKNQKSSNKPITLRSPIIEKQAMVHGPWSMNFPKVVTIAQLSFLTGTKITFDSLSIVKKHFCKITE